MALMKNEGEDVRHLFHCLLEVLDARDPQRMRMSFQLSELYQSILPYRANRTLLGFDSNQDYEMAVLRLVTGEGGYATVEPDEARDALAKEAAEINPDTGAFREYAGATVRLHPGAVAKVLDADRAYAPPSTAVETAPVAEPTADAGPPRTAELEPCVEGEPTPTPGASTRPDPRPVFSLDEADKAARDQSSRTLTRSPLCEQCGRALPLNRSVTYCPFCGRLAHRLACTRCGSELETGWRFCPDCGEPLPADRTSQG